MIAAQVTRYEYRPHRPGIVWVVVEFDCGLVLRCEALPVCIWTNADPLWLLASEGYEIVETYHPGKLFA